MNLLKKCRIGLKILSSVYKPRPIFVNWCITNKCPNNCKYCDIGRIKTKELSLEENFRIIDQLSKLGTEVVSFTGGEPLLKDNIEEIIDYCKQKGFYVRVNSSGYGLDKMKSIEMIDMIRLSLDGPEEVHDYQRGKGSFQEMIKALDISKKHNVNVNINCVITKHNLDYLNFLFNFAKLHKCFITFQPVTPHPYSKDITSLYPSEKKYKDVIQKIIDEKKRNKYIANSNAALKHLKNFFEEPIIECKVGKVSCRIEPDGFIKICSMDKVNKIEAKDFGTAFKRLQKPKCKTCMCASAVELNRLLSFNPFIIYNSAKHV